MDSLDGDARAAGKACSAVDEIWLEEAGSPGPCALNCGDLPSASPRYLLKAGGARLLYRHYAGRCFV